MLAHTLTYPSPSLTDRDAAVGAILTTAQRNRKILHTAKQKDITHSETERYYTQRNRKILHTAKQREIDTHTHT